MNKITQKVAKHTYKRIAKPLLFKLPPDKAHAKMVKASAALSRAKRTQKLGKKWFAYRPTAALTQELAGIHFTSPVGIAAGLDKNGEMMHVADMIGCGLTTVGSVTYEPRTGNPRPWFHRLPKTRSIVVHAGMPNRGIIDIAQRLKNRPATIPVFVSIAVVARDQNATDQEMVEDVLRTMQYIQKHKLAEAVEVNISCPNVRDYEYFTEPKRLGLLLKQIDALKYSLPVFLKMPNRSKWDEFEPMLDVILQHQVQGLTIANLVKHRDHSLIKDKLPDSVKGGLSGPLTKEQSTNLIRNTRRKCGDKLILIGLGGISSAKDAFDKLQAGADLVELATGLIYEGPQVVNEINAGLELLLKKEGCSSINELHGKNMQN